MSRTRSLAVCFTVAAGFAVAVATPRLLGQDNEASEAPAEKYEERFDHKVRDDLFAGFNGDEKALKRGMAKCEETLKAKPNHAEAMVWLGGARVYLAGEAFSSGDAVKGMQLWTKGLAEMDKAVKLEPNNVGVLIPRAAILLPAGRTAPAVVGKPVLQRVLQDFERTYERQKNSLDQLGEHPLGELRMGLADVYRLLGEGEKSRQQLLAVQKELPDTEYSKRATQWLKAPANKALAHNCIGCHSD